MNWNDVFGILTPIGTILGIIGGFFCVLTYIKSLRKPKARLRFANGKKKIAFSPHYCRAIAKKYYVGPQLDSYDASAYEELVKRYNQKLKQDNEFILPFRFMNTGKLQLENYRVEIDYDNGIKEIGVKPYQSLTLQEFIENTNELDGVCINFNKRQIVYSSQDKSPLNQKDYKDFAVRFSPNPDAEQIVMQWRISAKDFSKGGKLVVHLTPTTDEYTDIHFKNCERDVPEGGDLIEDLKPYIEQMKKLLTQTRK